MSWVDGVSCASGVIVSSFGVTAALLGVAYHYYKMCQSRTLIHKLQEVVEARGIFMNVTSHELRNPMTTIYASMDLLQHYEQRLDVTERQEIFENIRKSILRMTRMMDRIVLVGRLQHQQITYHPQSTDILALCSSIIEGLADKDAKQRIQVVCEKEQPPIIAVDPSLVEYILGNLLGNALKYSKEDVILAIKTENNTVQFDILDRGIGIPREEVPKLTQLFGRCSNTYHCQGIGIGMYLAVRCVALHQGTLLVATELGKGTHFRLILPLMEDIDETIAAH
ncbi:MAG: HAMP domain-containing histidine kinase [Verrucomicrobiota bacterium]|nr:MAG: HAMP domain-containing histidine kinase [Verrucomicrobiota bacterium]